MPNPQQPWPGQAQPPHGQSPDPQNFGQQPQPQAPQGFGQPPAPAFGQSPAAPQGFGQPGVPQSFGQQPQSFGQPSAPQGFGQQPQGFGQQPQGFGQQPQGFGQQPAAPQGFGQQPAPQSFGQAYAPSYPQAAGLGFAGYGATGSSGAHTAPSSTSDDSAGMRPIAYADATVGMSDRVRFIRMTYAHLFGAILVFAGLLYLLMTNPFLIQRVSIPLVKFALGGRWNWGIVLLAFMAVSWVADYWASHTTSRGLQYVGLGVYVVAEALIFVPLLAIVQWKTAEIVARGGGNPNILRDSAIVTLGLFAALTASVFVTKKDFSFMRSGLALASGAALLMIGLSLAFGFNLGLVFSVAMVLLAAGYILYQTSQVLAHYDPQNYVAASLALFSSIALMFWYVIKIFMRARE
ncbi:MAG: Bax inhibitor-1/YccA family protein [Kofleriaceae bacterium]